MIENVVMDGEAATIEMPVAPFTHVRRIGEDIVATEMILPRHRRVSAYDVGRAFVLRGLRDRVFKQIRIRVIPTGDEVMDFTTHPAPGPARWWRAIPCCLPPWPTNGAWPAPRVPPVRDDPDALAAALEDGLPRTPTSS